MPKNFDELLVEDLSFVIRGTTFTMQYVRPEVMAEWEDSPDPATSGEAIADAHERVKLFLVPGDRDRWDEVRSEENGSGPPITSQQMTELLRWMVEVQTGRPSRRDSDSQPGPGSTDPSSTAGSQQVVRQPTRPRARRR